MQLRAKAARELMKLTGHKTEAVYRRYAIVSETDLREGGQKLAALDANHQGEPKTVLPLPRSRTEVAHFRDSEPKVGLGGGN